MYQETKIHNTQKLYFTFLSLLEKAGIRKPRTVRVSMQRLISKKNVVEIINKYDEHLDIGYCVF
jgi:hypothetical protein